MCYILYGVVDKDINHDDYEIASKSSPYNFKIGTRHDVKEDISNNSYEYRITDWVCDCEFPVGLKNADSIHLVELAALINKLKEARDSKYIYISKTWAGKRNKSEKNVHIDEIDTVSFLANMELNCLYRIDF